MSPAVLLEDPKWPNNLGAVVRACACFGVGSLYWTGTRIDLRGTGRKGRLPREERLPGYRSVGWEHIQAGFDFQRIAQGRIPVAIEARRDFQSLPWFEHPANPLYIFGPEDGGLSGWLYSQAHSHVVIPTRFCTNLAAAVYIVLYDREAKRIRNGGAPLEFQGRASGWTEDIG